MAERIESLVASHQTLCADMVHELRSPLTRLVLAVRGNGTAGSLDQLEREASRINELADQLLEVARSEVDANSLELEALDFESMLTEIADHCRIEAAERGCEIELKLAEPGHVNGDAELLRRAIENVLRNAINHLGVRGLNSSAAETVKHRRSAFGIGGAMIHVPASHRY